MVTGWAQKAVLSHQCDTLPGDSGSPLLLKVNGEWKLIGVQSSAPAAKDRYLADNRAIAVTAFVTAWTRWPNNHRIYRNKRDFTTRGID